MRSPFRRRMDRLEMERLGRVAGLPAAVAGRIADVVAAAELSADHREEVFQELVSHFHDGLEAGQTADQLLASFGGGVESAVLIRQSKRVLTPESDGGLPAQVSWLAQAARDARYAVRHLLATPVFTATAVLSLALGIGANTAVFSLINEVILRRPPVQHPERLVDVYRSTASAQYEGLSEPDLEDLRRLGTVFSGVASARLTWVWYDAGEAVVQFTGEAVSADYFQVLGLRPVLGRLIEPADAPAPGKGAVVVLSERTWRNSFAADPDIIGRSLRLNGAAYQVLGIAPATYPGRLRAFPTDLFVPVMMIDQLDHAAPGQLLDRRSSGTFATFQLQPGLTRVQAKAEVDRLAADLHAQRLPSWEGPASFDLIPQANGIIDPAVDRVIRPVAGMLMLVVGLVLIVACANLAGFLLARAVDRRKENAVRLALGAGRSLLVVQVLVETVLIAAVAGVLGTLLGRAALRVFLSAEVPFPIPLGLDLPFDWRVVTFSVLVSLTAGIVFGLIPALQSTRLDLGAAIRDQVVGGGRPRAVWRSLLVGGQVAVSMVLLVVGVLFVRSFDAARRIDPGFGQAPGILAWLSGRPDSASDALGRLVREVAQIPGVEAVGLTSFPHLSPFGPQLIEIAVDGVEPPPGRAGFDVDAAAVDTGYVAAIGLRLVDGRNLMRTDQDSTWRSALVNEEFVRRFFPGRSGLHRRFRHDGREVEIVGVVNTARIRSLGETSRPFVYYPGGAVMEWLAVRTARDASSILPELRRAVNAADPDFLIARSSTMADFMGSQSYPFKVGASLLMGLAILAMTMASIGLYGAVSYAVAQRTREVGIRLSLGASPRAMVTLLLRSGLRVVAGGVVVGLVLALGVGRLLEQLFFGVSAFDPITLIAVTAVLLGTAFIAIYLPARKVISINPVSALKRE